jgi:glycerophosphoryl diester phosphodiesterase
MRDVRLGVLACIVAFGAIETGSAQVIVGHRGASYDAPENTLAAFKLAWQQGADGIEGDFYLTKDGQIVCIHDSDTTRTGGKKLVVKDSTLAELLALDYGSWKGPQFAGEKIPTFAEVLAVVPEGKLFVIELKSGPEIVPVMKAELERLKPKGVKLLLITFDDKTVQACKRELPGIRVHWLTGYKQNKETGVWSPGEAEVAERLRNSHADGLGTQGSREVVTSDFLARLRQAGMKEFHAWTIDKPEDAKYFQSLGAVGITTNRPQYIREALQQNGTQQ